MDHKKDLSLKTIEAMSPLDIQKMLFNLLDDRAQLTLENQKLRRRLQEVQASRDRYFEIFNKAPVGYITVDMRGRVLEANEGSALMLGRSRQELVGRSLKLFIHKKDHDIYRLHRKKLIRSRALGFGQSCELRLIKADKSSFWVFLEATAIEDASGSVVCRVIISDIDRRKRAEDSLRFERSQLLSIFDSISAFIFVSDPRTHEILFVNEFMKKSFSKDFVGRICYQELHERNSPCDFCTNPIILENQGQPYHWEYYNPLLKKHFLITDKLIKWPDGRDVRLELAIDITKRKLAEKQLKKANEQLQKVVDERDKFFSIIAHDLKSPLMGFLVFIRMLTERIEKLSLEDIQRLAREMKQSAENLYNLLENLLQWSIMKREAADFLPVVCRLAETVRENISLMQGIAVHKNVRFRCSVPENLEVHADKSMLKIILRNLLSNAVKFSREGGEVMVSARADGSRIHIIIEDQGVGMDQKTISSLFALDKITSRKGTGGEKGTGLGLLLCREYIARHEGEIWVQSIPDKGTVFHFTLPLKGPDEQYQEGNP